MMKTTFLRALRMRRYSLGFWLAVGFLLVGTSGRCDGTNQADLYVEVNASGAADVWLHLPFTPPDAQLWIAKLEETVGGPLENVEIKADDSGALSGRSLYPKQGLTVEGLIHPGPLADLLRKQGVSWLTVNITCPPTPQRQMPPLMHRLDAAYIPAGSLGYSLPIALQEPASVPPQLQFTFGYPVGDLERLLGAMLVALAVPVLLTLWMRRAALRARNADPAAIWFSYLRLLRWQFLVTLLVWLLLIVGTRSVALVNFLCADSRGGGSMIGWYVLLVLPPALARILCTWLSHPVFARVRGMEWTPGDLVRQAAWGYAASLLPIGLGLQFGADLVDAPRVAPLWLVAALAVRVIAVRRWTQALNISAHALTVGDLRDRVFALAEKAKVKVGQIYFLPTGKGRLANAFAMQGNNVLLTDYLLQHLNKREVDAIIAHELTHLQCKHPIRLARIGGGIGAICGGIIAVMLLTDSAYAHVYMAALPVVIVLGAMTFYYLSRRFEREADAGAIALTGDPEAMITGLARVMRLNMLPMDWGKWSERLLTHPSTVRRAQALARKGGIAPERLQAILSAPDDTAERYALPSTLGADDTIFSTLYKSYAATRIGLLLASVTVLPPVIAVWCAQRMALDSWERWGVYGLGLLVAALLYRPVANSLYMGVQWDLRRRLRRKLDLQGIPTERGIFVYFAPDAPPRLYEGFYNWDIGWLFLESDRLCYVGEQTRFALRPEQLVAAQVEPPPPGTWRGPCLSITWREDEDMTERRFSIRLAESPSPGAATRHTKELAQDMQTWHTRSHALTSAIVVLPAALAALEPPVLGDVTSLSPRVLGSLRALLRRIVFMAVLAACVSAVLGLEFDVFPYGAWYVLLVAIGAGFLQWLPFCRYREPVAAHPQPNTVVPT